MSQTLQSALIVGAGSGLSASLARAFAKAGMSVALAARSPTSSTSSCRRPAPRAFNCDAGEARRGREAVRRSRCRRLTPDVVVYNASARARGPFLELDPAEVAKAIESPPSAASWWRRRRSSACCRAGAAPCCSPAPRPASRAMRSRRPSPWASSRCAAWRKAWRANWRRKASMSRISSSTAASAAPRRAEPPDKPDSLLDPDAIAQTYLHVLQQPRSAWTWEVELRPWVEKF